MLLTREIVSTAIPLAHFVGGDSPSVINAATERGQTLVGDVTGAFKLAEKHRLRSDDLAPAAPITTAEGNAELPLWLNVYQLAAWVLYRDPAIVAKAGDWYGLAGQTLYGKEPAIGGYAPLERALQSGQLMAHGAKRSESFAAIPPVEWTRLRIAPLDMAHQWPYVAIQVSRSDAVGVFPESNAAAYAVETVRGELPTDDAIRAKMQALVESGMRRDQAAKHIRSIPGFEAVQNEHARRVVRGTLPRGRPKRADQKSGS